VTASGNAQTRFDRCLKQSYGCDESDDAPLTFQSEKENFKRLGILEQQMTTQVAVTPSSDPLDFDALKHRCLSNTTLMHRLLGTFLERVESDIQALDTAVSTENFVSAAAIAHKIKGTSLSVSANGLATLAGSLESQCHSDTRDRVSLTTDPLRQEFAAVVSCVKSVSEGCK
jgi:HPt (histidine-containing phosphotransfer) domain-containing protein